MLNNNNLQNSYVNVNEDSHLNFSNLKFRYINNSSIIYSHNVLLSAKDCDLTELLNASNPDDYNTKNNLLLLFPLFGNFLSDLIYPLDNTTNIQRLYTSEKTFILNVLAKSKALANKLIISYCLSCIIGIYSENFISNKNNFITGLEVLIMLEKNKFGVGLQVGTCVDIPFLSQFVTSLNVLKRIMLGITISTPYYLQIIYRILPFNNYKLQSGIQVDLKQIFLCFKNMLITNNKFHKKMINSNSIILNSKYNNK